MDPLLLSLHLPLTAAWGAYKGSMLQPVDPAIAITIMCGYQNENRGVAKGASGASSDATRLASACHAASSLVQAVFHARMPPSCAAQRVSGTAT